MLELNQLPAERRQALFEEAVHSVNSSHGRMSNVAHYVGCVLVGIIALAVVMAGSDVYIAVLAAIPAYFGALLVGVLLWRRSMALQLRKVLRQLIAAQDRRDAGANA